MTAIAGFISPNPTHDGDALVHAMLARMDNPSARHGEVYRQGPVTFGCLREAKAESGLAGSLPSANKQFFAVARGDVLNHKEESASLLGSSCAAGTQVENLMALFTDKGVSGLAACNGPASLAVRDVRQRLTHLFRDRYGELTLYYASGEDYFAFASEMKALFVFVTPRLNTQALSYKAFEFTVGSETLFEGITSLGPGDKLEIRDDGSYTLSSWWRIWEHLEDVPGTPKKDIDLVGGLLEDAVTLRSRNRGNDVGCMLSGGLDSSLVACIAKPARLYHAHYDFDDFNGSIHVFS